MYPSFFAFDTETTGLDPSRNEIISIAMLLLDASLNELSRKVIYAHPDNGCEERAAEVNGYTPELWTEKGAVSQTDMFAQLYEYLRKFNRLMPAGHNVKFDIDFLKALFRRNSSPSYSKIFSYHSVDTISTQILFDMAKFGKVDPSLRLTNLCERFDIKLDNAHDALADVEATVELLRFQYKALGGSIKSADVAAPNIQSRMLVKRATGWHLASGKHKGKPLLDVAKAEPDYLGWMVDNVSELSEEQKAAITKALAV